MDPRDGMDYEARIRERAYQLWIEHGQPHGRADDHWEEARRLVERESASNVGLDEMDDIASGPATDAAVQAANRRQNE